MAKLKNALNYFAQSACTQQERDQVHTIRTALAEQEAEIARLTDVLLRGGFAKCDSEYCMCGSWHHRYGLPERMSEISDELRDSGVLNNSTGNLPLNAIRALRSKAETDEAALNEAAGLIQRSWQMLDVLEPNAGITDELLTFLAQHTTPPCADEDGGR